MSLDNKIYLNIYFKTLNRNAFFINLIIVITKKIFFNIIHLTGPHQESLELYCKNTQQRNTHTHTRTHIHTRTYIK